MINLIHIFVWKSKNMKKVVNFDSNESDENDDWSIE